MLKHNALRSQGKSLFKNNSQHGRDETECPPTGGGVATKSKNGISKF